MPATYIIPPPQWHDGGHGDAPTAWAALRRDAYLHASRRVPTPVLRAIDMRGRLLAARILPSEDYAAAWESHGMESCGLALGDPGDPMSVLVLDGEAAPPIPPEMPTSFPCYGAGLPVLDGGSVVGRGEAGAYTFRRSAFCAAGLLLLASETRNGLGYDFQGRWPGCWDEARQSGMVTTALPLACGPRQGWAELFGAYYALDAQAQTQIAEDWAEIPGLLEAIFAV